MAVIFLDEFRPSLNCTKYNKLTNISNEIPLESVPRIIESLRLRKTLKIDHPVQPQPHQTTRTLTALC